MFVDHVGGFSCSLDENGGTIETSERSKLSGNNVTKLELGSEEVVGFLLEGSLEEVHYGELSLVSVADLIVVECDSVGVLFVGGFADNGHGDSMAVDVGNSCEVVLNLDVASGLMEDVLDGSDQIVNLVS